MAQHNVSTSCILLHDNKVLMVKELQKGKVNWDIPAGGLDQGETLLEGVCREVKEETGITIGHARLQRIFQFMQGAISSFNYLFMYDLNEKELGQIQITEKDILEIGFFEKSEIQKLIDENNVEHELAKYRLLEIFNDRSDVSDDVTVI